MAEWDVLISHADVVGGRRRESDRAGERNRTTAMLVAVVLCFVVTELPQGVLAFLSGVPHLKNQLRRRNFKLVGRIDHVTRHV